MDTSSSKGSSFGASPFSTPLGIAELVAKRIVSWTEETGLSPSVCVLVDHKIFKLHKYVLMSKSGYFRRTLSRSMEVELPSTFPGESQTLEWIILFMYDYPLSMDPFHIAAIRCAAEFFEMYENHCAGNLCELSDLYLNRVVLQHWEDALIVLQKSHTLQPWCETLLIVSRCIESLAFMACMDVLDPEHRKEKPIITFNSVAGRPWNSEAVKELLGQYLWIKDLIALPFEFFQRIIGSMRRHGMEEKFLCSIVVFYANKWVLSRKTRQFWEMSVGNNESHDVNDRISSILQGVVELLRIGQKACSVIPVGFFLSLLSRSLRLHLANDVNMKLQYQIASLLDLAQVDELLFPEKDAWSTSSCAEVEAMKEVFIISVTSFTNPGRTFRISKLWDLYLSRIVIDPKMSSSSFVTLVEIIPISERQHHDHLYRAIDAFLSAHLHISDEEKMHICKDLSCQKLSQKACIEAVQNEQMPLRLIVQALFVQQINTQKALEDCSESFRLMHSSELFDSVAAPRSKHNADNHGLEYDYYKDDDQDEEETDEDKETLAPTDMPLSFLLKRETHSHKPNLTEDDLELTSFRIECLEQEVMTLKKRIKLQNHTKLYHMKDRFKETNLDSRSTSEKEQPLVRASGNCIASVNWSTQRKYARRILKVFQKISFFGRSKSKRKHTFNVQKSKGEGKPSECIL